MVDSKILKTGLLSLLIIFDTVSSNTLYGPPMYTKSYWREKDQFSKSSKFRKMVQVMDGLILSFPLRRKARSY